MLKSRDPSISGSENRWHVTSCSPVRTLTLSMNSRGRSQPQLSQMHSGDGDPMVQYGDEYVTLASARCKESARTGMRMTRQMIADIRHGMRRTEAMNFATMELLLGPREARP